MPLPSDYADRRRQERKTALLSRLAAQAIAREAEREIAAHDERRPRKET